MKNKTEEKAIYYHSRGHSLLSRIRSKEKSKAKVCLLRRKLVRPLPKERLRLQGLHLLGGGRLYLFQSLTMGSGAHTSVSCHTGQRVHKPQGTKNLSYFILFLFIFKCFSSLFLTCSSFSQSYYVFQLSSFVRFLSVVLCLLCLLLDSAFFLFLFYLIIFSYLIYIIWYFILFNYYLLKACQLYNEKQQWANLDRRKSREKLGELQRGEEIITVYYLRNDICI